MGGGPGSIPGRSPQCTWCPCGLCSRGDASDGLGAVELEGVAQWLVRGAAALVELVLAVPGHPDLHPTVGARVLGAVLDRALVPGSVARVVVAGGLLDSRAFWNCGYSSDWGGACGGRDVGPGGADAGLGGKVGAGAGGSEAAALVSFLVCWRLGVSVPLSLRVRLSGTGGAVTLGGWARKKGCVSCWLGLPSGGSAGVCMVALARFRVRSASFRTVSQGSVGHGGASGLSSKGSWRW